MSLSLARLLYGVGVGGRGDTGCAGIVTSLLYNYTHLNPVNKECGTKTDHPQNMQLSINMQSQVWIEPARVQVIRSQRLNHTVMRDAGMRCHYNIYFSPSWVGWKPRPRSVTCMKQCGYWFQTSHRILAAL